MFPISRKIVLEKCLLNIPKGKKARYDLKRDPRIKESKNRSTTE